MITPDFKPSSELSRQQMHDIRDLAQSGGDWTELQRHLGQPIEESRRLVLAALPKCYVFFEAASSATARGGDDWLAEVA